MTETLQLYLHREKVNLAGKGVRLLRKSPSDRLQADLESLADDALYLVKNLRRLCDSARKMLLAGVGDVYEAGESLRGVITDTLETAEHLAAQCGSYEEVIGGAVPGLAELRTALAEAREWTGRVLENWPRRDRPFGPVDPKMADRSYEQMAKGEYEDAGAILARLEGGGPLVKEE